MPEKSDFSAPDGFAIPDYLRNLGVPHLAEYFGLWAVQPEPFLAVCDGLKGTDVGLHVAEARAQPADSTSGSEYQVLPGGVAVVPIRGSLMKQTSSLSGGTSTVRARRQVRLAARDQEVAAILLLVDSPGGTVSGTGDLADDVAAANKQKPVVAFVEDLGASAAYWIASQARQVFANRTALVGSIGTFAVIEDLSSRAAALGIKVHVIRAGAFKGAGTPGTEITPSQLAEWQRVVDQSNAFFLEAVARGRRLPLGRVQELADGRVHLAADAQRLGLIDGVKTLDQIVAALARPSSVNRSFSQKGPSMITEIQGEVLHAAAPQPGPAGYHELTAACPGADPGFLCAQLEGKATVEQAQKAWMAELARRNAALTQQAEEAKAKTAAAKLPGVEAVGTGTSAPPAGDAGDPVAEFDRLVRERASAGQFRPDACVAVAKANPDLHRAYLLAINPGAKAQRLIKEKYDG